MEYDVVVIGAGPGGYVSAIRSAQRGAKTAVVERKYLGGVCLNIGCIPTKSLLHTAHLYKLAKRGREFGLNIDNLSIDLKELTKRKDKVISLNRGGIERLFKKYSIEFIEGEANIYKPNEVLVNDRKITTKNIIIATGGRPVELSFLRFDKNKIISSTEALNLTELPPRIGIIGAGAIGCEFACIWNSFGSEIHLIEMMPNILPKSDEELTKKLESIFKKEGIKVYTNTKVENAEISNNGIKLNLQGKAEKIIEVDTVLLSIGMRCNSELLQEPLRNALKINKKGGIIVNNKMETGIPGIYAIGDVIDTTWLAHGASAEGIVASTNATGGNKKLDYRVVPSCTFTFPELASVGLTEQDAKEKNIPIKIGKFPFMNSGRAHTIGETEGMVKVIANSETEEIIGVHILGPEAGELIATAGVAMKMEGTIEEVAETIFTHPTLSETIMEACEDFYGLSIHNPK
ncbi:MAG: dihydrolipoyl dehydrogenase [Candidatus Hydrogenedentes bacterium]|nr:dihydrolipoyl dehydrogenase [Candidatus Hydrogenedentota bacterium]